MPDQNVEARLMEMLQASRSPEAPAPAAPARNTAVAAGQNDDAASEWCRENPGLCTGRGPTGRLRNFRAMNVTKLRDTYDAVSREANDPEALNALRAEWEARGL